MTTTTTDYESMTDEELSQEIAESLGIEKHRYVTRKEKAVYEKGILVDDWDILVRHKPYATSLDACREAIEKCEFGVILHYFIGAEPKEHNRDVWPDYCHGEPGWRVDIDEKRICVLADHPARAACIAMLKALDKQ